MSLCPGCGGIVGRDCFNPSECQWISQDMAQRAQQSEQDAAMEYGRTYGWGEAEHFLMGAMRDVLYTMPGHDPRVAVASTAIRSEDT